MTKINPIIPNNIQTALKAKSTSFTEKVFHKLGTANDSEITTATIAAFKLCFVPLGIALDKKANESQKEYAILRNTLTELIALASYLGVTKIIKDRLPSPICKKYYAEKGIANVEMKKINEYTKAFDKNFNNPEKIKALNESPVGKYYTSIIEKINELNISGKFKKVIIEPTSLLKKSRSVIAHVTVCILAFSFIPQVCNLAMKPFSDLYHKLNKQNPQNNKALNLTIFNGKFIDKKFSNKIKNGGANA